MTVRDEHAQRRVRDALNLGMRVRLLADTRAELHAIERAICQAGAAHRVTADLSSEARAEAEHDDADAQDGLEQALRDLMAR